MTTALYGNVITFNLYDEFGQQVNLRELVESVVQTAEAMTVNDKIVFELIAKGFNPDPATGKFRQYTDSWLLHQLRDRLPKETFYTWVTHPHSAEHPALRVFEIKRNTQADLSYLL